VEELIARLLFVIQAFLVLDIEQVDRVPLS
jgi:hypothetical protein